MRHTLAVALVTQVHAVCVAVAAPAHGDTQAVHATLELVHVAAARRASGCKKGGGGVRCDSLPTKSKMILLLQEGSRLPKAT